MKLGIISVIYEEPYWQETIKCLLHHDYPIIFVDRGGTGSLAKSYNEGFRQMKRIYNPENIWFVSNISWQVSIPQELLKSLDLGFDCVQPCYESDHEHLRQLDIRDRLRTGTQEAKFIEFTCPMMRGEVFENIRLNENMPYWGHDLDWSYRAKMEGYKLAVNYNASIDHTYIRHNFTHEITKKRLSLRKLTDRKTQQELIKLYGNWKKKLL